MRRRLTMVLAALGLIGFSAAPCAGADWSGGWNGGWVGNWQQGDGAQIVFAGNELVALYWHGDYVADAKAAVAPDGATVTIVWSSASATLTRDSAVTAHVVIREEGKSDVAFALKKDE